MRKRVLIVLIVVAVFGFCFVVMETQSQEEELITEFFADVRGQPVHWAGLEKHFPDYPPEVREIFIGKKYDRDAVLAKLLQESFKMYKLWKDADCLLITWADFKYKGGILYVRFEGRKKHLQDCIRGSGDMAEPLLIYAENFDPLYDLISSSCPEEISRQLFVQSFWFDLTKKPRDSGLVLYRLIRFPKKGDPKRTAFFYAII